MTKVLNQAMGDNWALYLGDSCEVIKGIPDNSIHLGIHSPPFSNLYVYSDSEADMGNSNDDEEFFKHYEFLIEEIYRTTMPGRLCVVHCKDLPSYMNRDGAAGLVDFPGRVVKAFESKGWQYHSRVTIWKDPVIEMTRTKNHGLLHKNFAANAEACRQGMPDYLVVFRKWPLEGGISIKQNRKLGDYIGDNPPNEMAYKQQSHLEELETGELVDVITNKFDQRGYSIGVWQKYASPVWMDINQTRVLNFKLGKGNDDSKHICPLQLDVIARCVDLWSNPGEIVFSPFAGVGSEGYEAVKMGRKFIGIELKESYFKAAIKFLTEADNLANRPTLFDLLPEENAV